MTAHVKGGKNDYYYYFVFRDHQWNLDVQTEPAWKLKPLSRWRKGELCLFESRLSEICCCCSGQKSFCVFLHFFLFLNPLSSSDHNLRVSPVSKFPCSGFCSHIVVAGRRVAGLHEPDFTSPTLSSVFCRNCGRSQFKFFFFSLSPASNVN